MKQKWDVVIVGTGVGGSTAGHQLAASGRRVLFIELGQSNLGGAGYRGEYIDRLTLDKSEDEKARLRSESGRYREPIFDISKKTGLRFVPFIGSGTGGSSGLYGAAMTRFKDFEIDAKSANGWPLDYAQMKPHYEVAEKLYKIRSHNAPLTATAESFWNAFENLGLEPCRGNFALRRPGCKTACQGFLCAQNCKIDAAAACLVPAISNYGAALMTECKVIKVEADAQRVQRIVCDHAGENVVIDADLFILAAGALNTPAILQRSKSRDWKNGIGNNHDLVGRYFMRHFIDLWAIKPPNGIVSPTKEIGFDGLYRIDGEMFGTFHGFGEMPPIEAIQEELREIFAGNLILSKVTRVIEPFIRLWVQKVLSSRVLFGSILEDPPLHHNRVALGARGETTITYHIAPENMRKIKIFRKRISAALKNLNPVLFKSAEDNRRLGHICGTSRMGTDPKNSVVDSNCQVWGLENFYIVDGSVFPTSGGVNPALTIAANACRVASHLKDLR